MSLSRPLVLRGALLRAAPIRVSHVRHQTMGKPAQADFGGPGQDDFSQQDPLPKSPAMENFKRNWPMIGGGAILLLGAYAYFTGGGPKKGADQKMQQRSHDATEKAADNVKAKAGDMRDRVGEMKDRVEPATRKIQAHLGDAAAEMSGKKEGMGAFRGE